MSTDPELSPQIQAVAILLVYLGMTIRHDEELPRAFVAEIPMPTSTVKRYVSHYIRRLEEIHIQGHQNELPTVLRGPRNTNCRSRR